MPRIPPRTTPHTTLHAQQRHFKAKRDLALRTLGRASYINGGQYLLVLFPPGIGGDVGDGGGEDPWSGAEIYASELVKGSEAALLDRATMAALADECGRVNEARRKGAEEALALGRRARRAAGEDDDDEDDAAADSAIEESLMDAAALASKRLRSAKKPRRVAKREREEEEEVDPDRTLVNDLLDDDGGDHAAAVAAKEGSGSGLSMSEYLDLGFGDDATGGDYFAVKPAAVPSLAPAVDLFKTPARPSSTTRPSIALADMASSASPASTTLRIPFPSLPSWYSSRFSQLQQSTCKLVLKAWIKVVEPKKQSKHPYNRGEEGKPVWWPQGVRHKEPDHLMKPERAQLLLALVRSPLVPVSKLELATAEASAYIPQSKMRILREVYRVAKEEERRRGSVEEGQDIELHVPLSPPSTLASKGVSSVNRETRAIQAAGAGSPTQRKAAVVSRKRPRSDSQVVPPPPLFTALASTPLRPIDVNAPSWYAQPPPPQQPPVASWSPLPTAEGPTALSGILPTRGRMSHAMAARHAMHVPPPTPFAESSTPIPIGRVALPAWPPYPPQPPPVNHHAAFFSPSTLYAVPPPPPPMPSSFQPGDFQFQ